MHTYFPPKKGCAFLYFILNYSDSFHRESLLVMKAMDQFLEYDFLVACASHYDLLVSLMTALFQLNDKPFTLAFFGHFSLVTYF